MMAAAAKKAGRFARRTTPHACLDAAVLVALALAGITGFGPAFGGTSYLIAGLGGAVIGAAVALGCAAMRFGTLSTAGIAVVAYGVLGGPLAAPATTVGGVVPTLDTFRSLFFGAVLGWKQLVTVQPPVASFGDVLVVPYVAALLCTLIGTTIAIRAARWGWATLPPTVLFVTVIVFGADTAALPLAQSGAFVGIALGWAVWRTAQARHERGSGLGLQDAAVRRRVRMRAAASAAALAVAAGVITAGAAFAVPPPATRHVLRDAVQPPLDVHDLASPLVSFRKLVRDDAKTTLFTVKGLPNGARVRLATLDQYDGIVYSTAADGGSGSGAFFPVGTSIPPVSMAGISTANGTPVTLSISIGALQSAWLPDAGYAKAIDFHGSDAAALAREVGYNPQTGAAVIPAGVPEGTTYTIDAVIPPVYSMAQLRGKSAASVAMPQLTGVPDVVGSTATKDVKGQTTDIGKLHALALTLSHDGFFSHGLVGQAPSRAGHGAERISTLLTGTEMIGDDEQYSVAMALMARQLGLPARVVMGFYPASSQHGTGTIDITGDDLHAWVEVAIQGAGWVAFDPTPPKTQVPQQQAPKPKPQPKAQVLQPPTPPKPPIQLPPLDGSGAKGSSHHTAHGFNWGALLVPIGGVLLLLLILLAPAVAIGVLKATRRRHRFQAATPSARIGGGWSEVVDRAADLGSVVPGGQTRREQATVLVGTFPEAGIPEIATQADRGVFGPGEASDAEVEALWAQVDRAIGEMSATRGWFGRLRARLSLRSLWPHLRSWAAGLTLRVRRRR